MICRTVGSFVSVSPVKIVSERKNVRKCTPIIWNPTSL